ncbi:hypothetical protein HNQ93_000577 [Hymenobacter luteus]|uniref:DUF4177 domain-containing protein n=2 Tax=Hymenobacter TaxID=89966 RepID=A0A7W9SXI6_9BACT|nr:MULTISPECIES: hypothetical protein [Hymenobacter]MBB4599943.1 hypothetical protein [Hymenobacter latericoloratus]MBB6057747.1 hypothetical protein [Hymenobacter luteus]
MKYSLLIAVFLALHSAAEAQTTEAKKVARPVPAFPTLPEAAMQPTATVTRAPGNPAGPRFQYQLLKIQNGQIAILAPAWRGLTMLKPERIQKSLWTEIVPGSLDDKVMHTLNELTAEGWELLEVYNLSQPVGAQQSIETSLAFNDPNRPVYSGTTSITTYTETRYLLRRPLP